MSSQPQATDSAVDTPAPHKAEVPPGEVLPEPAEPPSEWQIDDDLIASLTNVPGSSIVNNSELEGYRAKLKLYRGHMKALFVAFDQLEKDFNKLVSDTKPYDPPIPQGKIVSAWHPTNRSAAPRRHVQRTKTMPMPSRVNAVQEQHNDNACSSGERILFGPWDQSSTAIPQESIAPPVPSSSTSRFDPSGRVAE